MRSTPASSTVLVYGLFLITVGAIGYYMSHSAISLIAGGSTGILALIAAFLLRRRVPTGAYIAMGISILMTLLFARRYMQSHKAMPALLVIGASLITLVVLFSYRRSWKR